MSDDELSPYERYLTTALAAAIDTLAADGHLEVPEEHRAALVTELLAAASNAENSRRMIKKIVRTLVDSERVEEVYASDDDLRDFFRAKLGRA
ncbi:MAG: hypothetical protein VYE22_02320 [Myxococcota bacterium]|nr:hypothetical protein [Myxococcota bacterium]